MARILCVDDEDEVRTTIQMVLERAGHQTVPARHVPEGFAILQRGGIDLVISDYQMPGIDGLEFLKQLADEHILTPVIMVTGFGGVDHAIAAVRAGAVDYLLKPFEPTELVHRVSIAIEAERMRRQLETLKQEAAEQRGARQIVGTSPSLARVLETVTAAAATRATVLIEGESGTGKELIARAVHDQSPRRDAQFIKLNCAALPDGLIESALFGHEKGAFTGAMRRVEGAFERAHGGTLLLDEISEMRLDLQAKLLRVLQEQEFERVGGTQTLHVDVRVVATTNRDLRAEAERGTFRQDLYFRLNVVSVHVPPLRDRVNDIPTLAYHFAARAAAEAGKRVDAITPEAMELLQRYPWPGNIRELQHTMERAVILSPTAVLGVASFDALREGAWRSKASAVVQDAALSGSANASAIALPSLDLDAAEEALIAQALAVSNQNRTKAAALLGIGVRTLRKKLNKKPDDDPD